MFKRGFFALLGLGAGVTLGAWSIRKIEAAQRHLAPDAIARRAGARAGGFSERLNAAIAEGRAAAATKEAELRAVYRVNPTANENE